MHDVSAKTTHQPEPVEARPQPVQKTADGRSNRWRTWMIPFVLLPGINWIFLSLWHFHTLRASAERAPRRVASRRGHLGSLLGAGALLWMVSAAYAAIAGLLALILVPGLGATFQQGFGVIKALWTSRASWGELVGALCSVGIQWTENPWLGAQMFGLVAQHHGPGIGFAAALMLGWWFLHRQLAFRYAETGSPSALIDFRGLLRGLKENPWNCFEPFLLNLAVFAGLIGVGVFVHSPLLFSLLLHAEAWSELFDRWRESQIVLAWILGFWLLLSAGFLALRYAIAVKIDTGYIAHPARQSVR